MPTPLRKPLLADPLWLAPSLWEQIESSQTYAFLAAHSSHLRVERWGDTLRLLSFSAPDETLTAQLLHPPAPHAWQPTRVIAQQEGEKTASFLLGSGWTTEAQELGLTYEIDLTPGVAAGLFPDQRENRTRLRTLRPKTLLNLFAHTCSFGVLAASTGAATLNVDSSVRSLARGRANYQRNHFTGSDHRFYAEDVRRVLPRLIRRGETFSAIILDPPTFSHGGKGKAFQISRELEPLLLACFSLLAPNGALLLSVNQSETNEAALHQFLLTLLARQGISARVEPGLRPPEVPPARMPASLWVIRQD